MSEHKHETEYTPANNAEAKLLASVMVGLPPEQTLHYALVVTRICPHCGGLAFTTTYNADDNMTTAMFSQGILNICRVIAEEERDSDDSET